MKTNNEERHKKDATSNENFDSSNDNNKRRAQSNDKGQKRRRRRPRVGDKAYVADPNNKHTGPRSRPVYGNRQTPSRDRNRDRHVNTDRYSSNRDHRGPVHERRDREDMDNREDRGNRPSYRQGGQGGQGGRRQHSDNQPRGRRGPNQRGHRGEGRRRPVLKKKKPIKPIKYKENADPNEPIRLNKYLANAGICSRREADGHIEAGSVKVNGEVVTELGTRILRSDEVMFKDKPIELESKVYVLLNKPRGFVTTTDDPQNRKTVMDLVKNACDERIYPVGRLDRATTGVLLLTNDGDLASKLTHPRYEKRKIYQVWVDKPVSAEHMQAIADGFELEDGMIYVDAVSYVTEEDLTQIGIEIHSGRNRIVRRIFEHFNYRVLRLDRVYFAGLTKKNLPRGRWRYLTEKEVNMLRMGAFD